MVYSFSMMIRIFPELVLLSRKNAAAIRTWHLVRSLLREGHGPVVKRYKVEDLFISQGISEQRWLRMTKAAQDKGYIREQRYPDGTAFYVVTGVDEVARLLGEELGRFVRTGKPAMVDLEGFCKVNGWREYVWAAYNSVFDQTRPMSQVAKRNRIGVPERTQRYWERETLGDGTPNPMHQAKISNWVDTGLSPDNLEGVRDFLDKPHATIKDGTVQWQIANNFAIPHTVAHAVSGRKYKANVVGKTGTLAGRPDESTNDRPKYWNRKRAPTKAGMYYIWKKHNPTKENTWECVNI